MFQLTPEEIELMVSQNAIPSKQHLGDYFSYVFTEQGIDCGRKINKLSPEFGDGGTSTLKNPTHTYSTADTYQVSLKAIDQSGLTDIKLGTITVSQGGSVPPPPAPAQVNASDGLYDDHIRVSWSPVENVDHYRIDIVKDTCQWIDGNTLHYYKIDSAYTAMNFTINADTAGFLENGHNFTFFITSCDADSNCSRNFVTTWGEDCLSVYSFDDMINWASELDFISYDTGYLSTGTSPPSDPICATKIDYGQVTDTGEFDAGTICAAKFFWDAYQGNSGIFNFTAAKSGNLNIFVDVSDAIGLTDWTSTHTIVSEYPLNYPRYTFSGTTWTNSIPVIEGNTYSISVDLVQDPNSSVFWALNKKLAHPQNLWVNTG